VTFTREGDSTKSATDKIMDASMDLMLRLPSSSVAKNLGAITELIQDEDVKADVELKTD
jgi:hypothetical protein